MNATMRDFIEYIESAWKRQRFESAWITENGERITCDTGYAGEWWDECMKPELIRVFDKEE